MEWNEFFKLADEKFGLAVTEEDSTPFVVCPECGEPFLKDDFDGSPVCWCCGYNLVTDEYEEDIEDEFGEFYDGEEEEEE